MTSTGRAPAGSRAFIRYCGFCRLYFENTLPSQEFDRNWLSFHTRLITRESLDRYLSAHPFAKPPVGVQHHLSPYMHLMLSVAQRLSITVEHQPKKEIVIEELRRCWPSSVPRSENLLDAMATLLREPGSQLGRAKKVDPRA